MKNSPLHRSAPVPGTNPEIKGAARNKYGSNIAERSLQFGLRAIGVYGYLQKQEDNAARILAGQFLRSATSIGANVEEAQSAESRADFIHKLRIAQKEARESRYWIRLLRESAILDGKRSELLYRESDEILRILSKIIVNTQANRAGKNTG